MLMYKILFLRLLLLVKCLKLIRFNLHLLVKIKIKIKGKVIIRRIKIIINNPINPRLILLMTNTRTNLLNFSLSVARIIIRKIFHNVLRLVSSFKGPGGLLHPPYCHNHFLLSNRPNWSLMNNLLPLPCLMYLCVPMTPRRTKLQSLLKPNIILLQKRNLMIHHLRWFNLLHQLHLLTVIFISNDRA
jgi:hypothetical protein